MLGKVVFESGLFFFKKKNSHGHGPVISGMDGVFCCRLALR